MDNKTMWSMAAINGLYISLVTIVADLTTTLFELTGGLGFAISFLKFGLIIYLLYRYMKAYTEKAGQTTYGQSFTYGFTLCFCSAIVCTLFSLLLYTLIAPDTFEKSIEQSLTMFESMGVSENLELDYDTMMGILPKAITFGVFVKCILIGLIETLIIANFTKKDDVFGEVENSEE